MLFLSYFVIEFALAVDAFLSSLRPMFELTTVITARVILPSVTLIAASVFQPCLSRSHKRTFNCMIVPTQF